MSVLAHIRLDGRTVLLTGGSGHVGRMAARTFLELGARVCVLDRAGESLDKAVAELAAVPGNSGRIHALPTDLASESETRAAVRRVVAEHGGLDILVHAAAFVGTTQFPGWGVPFAQQSVAAWDAAFRVNLTSAFILAQEAQSALASSGHGSIVLVSSIYGSVAPDWSLYEGTAMANPAAYGASKAGLEQLTRYLATTLAPRVRVNAVSPGGIERGQPQVFQERYCKRTPLGRMAREEDLAGALAFLASDLSAYVTGQVLMVDGGWTSW